MRELPERWTQILPYLVRRLQAIPGVGPKTAEKLVHQALHSVREVAQADPEALNVGGISKEHLRNIIEEARKMMNLGSLAQKETRLKQIQALLRKTEEEGILRILRELENTHENAIRQREAFTGKPTQQDIINDISYWIKEDKLIPFIGAGFSKNVSPSIPTGTELTKLLAKKLRLTPDQCEQLSSLGVAELYVRKFSKASLVQLLQANLKTTDDQLAQSDVHIHLATLNPSRIYTTNFDCFIERVFSKTPITLERIVSVKDLSRAMKGRTQLVKLHGSLNLFPSDDFNPEDLVITESDYFRRIWERHPFEALLEADLCERALIFIGYSFNDPNIGYLWNLLSAMPEWTYMKRSYFVVYEGQDYDPAQVEFFASKGIMVISLEHEGWTLSQFLGAIAAKVAARRSNKVKKDFTYRSRLAGREPIFLTGSQVRRLAEAFKANNVTELSDTLSALFYKVPSKFHFDEYSSILVDIVNKGDLPKEVREEALERMVEQTEIFTKDGIYQNFRTKAYRKYANSIVQSLFDKELGMKASILITGASGINQNHYCKLLLELLERHASDLRSLGNPDNALYVLEYASHSFLGKYLLKQEQYSQLFDQLVESFPDTQERIARIRERIAQIHR